jgi:hypothetical protein
MRSGAPVTSSSVAQVDAGHRPRRPGQRRPALDARVAPHPPRGPPRVPGSPWQHPSDSEEREPAAETPSLAGGPTGRVGPRSGSWTSRDTPHGSDAGAGDLRHGKWPSAWSSRILLRRGAASRAGRSAVAARRTSSPVKAGSRMLRPGRRPGRPRRHAAARHAAGVRRAGRGVARARSPPSRTSSDDR